MVTDTREAEAGKSPWRNPIVVIVAGCLISAIGFGIRSTFGIYLEPMTSDLGWTRETYAFAMALQNLFWGLVLPIAGGLADKYGSTRVIALGAVVYALGVWGMSIADSGFMLSMTGGVLAGTGIALSAFTLAMAAMARVVSPGRRSLVFGLGTAAGSFGQVLFSPIAQNFVNQYGWSSTLVIFGFTALVLIPLAWLLPADPSKSVEPTTDQTLRAALQEALQHRGYLLLTLGFFVCGFHVAFITVHFPAYIRDLGLDPIVGAYSLALIGLFNIVGSFGSGYIGQRRSKKQSLAAIYFLRAIVIALLLVSPKTAEVIYLFAAVMGLLWLSTVPLTTGIVAQVFGVRYMATLFGIVFLSHQLGSFIGVWWGGRIYDQTGSYNPMWIAGIVLGLVAAVVHVYINEKPLERLANLVKAKEAGAT